MPDSSGSSRVVNSCWFRLSERDPDVLYEVFRHQRPNQLSFHANFIGIGLLSFLVRDATGKNRMNENMEVRQVDYRDEVHAKALLRLLDMYAQDPMGGGSPLTEEVKSRLCTDLSDFPGAYSAIAWLGERPVGLINAFVGYSTFKARPLMNVHDIAVMPDVRGQGVGQALLTALEEHARGLGCCKLTLEVLSGNTRGLRSYEQFGFEHYALDPQMGQAMFMQKWLA